MLGGIQNSNASKSQNPFLVAGIQQYTGTQFADGTNTLVPVKIDSSTWSVASVGGSEFTIAIKSNGTLWGWGYNLSPFLGLGADNTQKNTPVQIDSNTNWSKVSSGVDHTIAIKSNGTMWGWGFNTYQQIGIDSMLELIDTPTQIGTDTNWSSVSSGDKFSVAIKSNGTLWAWGINTYGQLGDGTTDQHNTPVQIGTDTNWVSVACGQYHTVAIKSNGTIWAWGSNSNGQLGDGTTTDHYSPAQIGSATNWSSVSCGNFHTMAIKTTGTLWGFGSGGNGVMGDGTIVDKLTPTQIGSGTNWSYISAGFSVTAAIKSDGTLWTTGYNSSGQLGIGNKTTITTFTQVGTDTNWSKVYSFGGANMIGIKTNGEMWGWGINGSGSVGCGAVPSQNTNSKLVEIHPNEQFIKIVRGNFFSIGLKSNGTLWSWGDNTSGQLGLGTSAVGIERAYFSQIGTDTDWASVSCGPSHIMAIKTNGTLWAWGSNLAGQLGIGIITDKYAPFQVGTDTNWASVACGNAHSVAIKTTGTLWATGYNDYGQLGDGTTTSRTSFVQIGSDTNWSSVVCGGSHTTAIKSTGTLWGWGFNSDGQVGNGTNINQTSPVQIGTDTNWSKCFAAGGSYFSIALKTNGTLWAWGSNYDGCIGSNDYEIYLSPNQIGTGTSWSDVYVGYVFVVAKKTDGTLWAWGNNGGGQFGQQTNTGRGAPYELPNKRCILSPIQIGQYDSNGVYLGSYPWIIAVPECGFLIRDYDYYYYYIYDTIGFNIKRVDPRKASLVGIPKVARNRKTF